MMINGNLVDLVRTDENGEALSRELPVGDYYIKEVSAAVGYVMDGEERIVRVREKETTEIEIGNKKKPAPRLPRTGF